MFTLALAVCHAFATNSKFDPEALYLGTVFLDLVILAIIENLLY